MEKHGMGVSIKVILIFLFLGKICISCKRSDTTTTTSTISTTESTSPTGMYWSLIMIQLTHFHIRLAILKIIFGFYQVSFWCRLIPEQWARLWQGYCVRREVRQGKNGYLQLDWFQEVKERKSWNNPGKPPIVLRIAQLLIFCFSDRIQFFC